MPDLVAWRIDKRKWRDVSFSGAGAAAAGGRWNSANVPVVYVSASLAMAALEKYVHLPKPVPARMELVRFRLRFDSALVEQVDPENLPPDWQEAPAPLSTAAIGDQWVSSARSAVLAIPSALIPEETNYLFNPAHPDFRKIEIEAPEAFAIDYRIARLVEPTG